MTMKEIFEMLDIESVDEFEYFEQLADLMEHEGDIPYDVFYTLFNQMDSEIIAELLDSYFEDFMLGIPDDASDFYTLVTTIHQVLIGLLKASGEENMRHSFIDELFRFRNFCVFDSNVICRDLKNRRVSEIPLIDALSFYRMGKLVDNKCDYDFTQCMDYKIEEFVMPISAFSDEEYDLDDEDY